MITDYFTSMMRAGEAGAWPPESLLDSWHVRIAEFPCGIGLRSGYFPRFGRNSLQLAIQGEKHAKSVVDCGVSAGRGLGSFHGVRSGSSGRQQRFTECCTQRVRGRTGAVE